MFLRKPLICTSLFFGLWPLSVFASDFFPDHPAGAPLLTATGILTDFGVGNASGTLTIKDAASSKDYNIGRSTTLEGKPIDCQSPPAPGFKPSKDECPYWPSDVVLGKTRVRVRYWTQVRPDTGGTVRVALSIEPLEATSGVPTAGKSREAFISHVFAEAKAGDAKAIIAERAAANAKGDTRDDDIYDLALYTVSPEAFRADFVRSFPTTTAGVMSDYGTSVAGRNLVSPSMLPFSAIGTIAALGDSLAFRKLYLAYEHSDGAPAESLASALSTASAKQPLLSLTTLAGLSSADLTKIFSDAAAFCSSDGPSHSLVAVHTTDESALSMQKKIITLCASPAATAPTP